MAEFDFNPERVAYFEASGWRAYYDRNWLRLFRLIAALCREQFSTCLAYPANRHTNPPNCA